VTGSTELEDVALFKRFTVEDRARIIEKYQPLVFHVYSKLCRRDLPENVDLISEGTLGLIEAVDSFDPDLGVKFKTFAYHKIRGKMLDFLRRQRRFFRVPEELASLEFPFSKGSFRASYPRALELIALVQSLLSYLSPVEREIIELVYLEGLSQEETATRLACTPANVSIMRKRAIKRLSELLNASDVQDSLAFQY